MCGEKISRDKRRNINRIHWRVKSCVETQVKEIYGDGTYDEGTSGGETYREMTNGE